MRPDAEPFYEHARPGHSKARPKSRTPDRMPLHKRAIRRRDRHRWASKSSNSKSDASTVLDLERQVMLIGTVCLAPQASSTTDDLTAMHSRNSGCDLPGKEAEACN